MRIRGRLPDIRAVATALRRTASWLAQAQVLLLEIQAHVMVDASFKDAQRGKMLTALAIADKALVDGADEFLQLLAVASQVQKLANAA